MKGEGLVGLDDEVVVVVRNPAAWEDVTPFVACLAGLVHCW
jgi:hypothetical protein